MSPGRVLRVLGGDFPPGSLLPPDSPSRGQPQPLPAPRGRALPAADPPSAPAAAPGAGPGPPGLPRPPSPLSGSTFLQRLPPLYRPLPRRSPSPVTAGLFECSPGFPHVHGGEPAVALPGRSSQSSAVDRGQQCVPPSERVRPLKAPEVTQAWPAPGHPGFTGSPCSFSLPIPSPKLFGQASGARMQGIIGVV